MSIVIAIAIAGLFIAFVKGVEGVSFVIGAFYARHNENHAKKQMMQIRRERASH